MKNTKQHLKVLQEDINLNTEFRKASGNWKEVFISPEEFIWDETKQWWTTTFNIIDNKNEKRIYFYCGSSNTKNPYSSYIDIPNNNQKGLEHLNQVRYTSYHKNIDLNMKWITQCYHLDNKLHLFLKKINTPSTFTLFGAKIYEHYGVEDIKELISVKDLE